MEGIQVKENSCVMLINICEYKLSLMEVVFQCGVCTESISNK